MFLLSVFLLGCFCQVSLTASSPKLNFGCTFDNDNYFKAPITEENGSVKPAYSTEPLTSINFDNLDDVTAFYNKLNVIRDDVLANSAYNNVDVFLKFYEGFQKSGLKDVEEYYKQYEAAVDTQSTGASRTIEVFNRLAKEYPNAANSMYLGGTATYSAELKKLDVSTTNSPLESKLPYDRVVGFIKFTFMGQREGYILVDMGMTIDKCPLLMVDGNKLDADAPNPKRLPISPFPTFHKVPFHEMHTITYSFLNGNKDFILNKELETYNTTYKDEVTYVGRSICSFVQSVVKTSLLDPVKQIYIPHQAWIEFNLAEQKEDKSVVNIYIDNQFPVALNIANVHNLNKEEKSVIQSVEELIPELNGKLLDKLNELSKIEKSFIYAVNEITFNVFHFDYLYKRFIMDKPFEFGSG